MPPILPAGVNHWVTPGKPAGPGTTGLQDQRTNAPAAQPPAAHSAPVTQPATVASKTTDPATEAKAAASTRAALAAQEEAQGQPENEEPAWLQTARQTISKYLWDDRMKRPDNPVASYPPGTDPTSIPYFTDPAYAADFSANIYSDGSIDIVTSHRVFGWDIVQNGLSDPRQVLDGSEAGFQRYVSNFEETQSANAQARQAAAPSRQNALAADQYERYFLEDTKGAALLEKDGDTVGIVYEDGRLNVIDAFSDKARDLLTSANWRDVATQAAERFGAEITLAPAFAGA